MTSILDTHPHAHQPVLRAGVPIEEANGVVILLHGRGSPAANIIRLANDLAPDPGSEQRIAYLAPQAIHNTWYPYRFIEPVERNEPYLGSALKRIDEMVIEAVDQGLHSRQVLLVGFSQGACLGLEYVARGTSQVAGVAGIAGGLIGDPAVTRPALPGLEGTQVFIGCGDQDDHIDIDHGRAECPPDGGCRRPMSISAGTPECRTQCLPTRLQPRETWCSVCR